MAKKLSELEDGPRRETERSVDAIADSVEQKMEESNARALHSEYGLCANCTAMACVESEFRVELAMCMHHNLVRRRLRSDRPVTKCTEYESKSTPDLFTMKQMAWLIDPPPRKAGFIQEEDE